MKTWTFAVRTAKEILRDPLNLFFGLGFPVILLLLMSAIQANIPVELFELPRLTPGITVFGASFMTLFSATLLARDRESAFLQRLYTMPLRPSDFIFGYMLPLLPIAVMQRFVCYLFAFLLGLPLHINVLYAILLNIPASFFFISLGLLCGSLFNVKQVGGICGALLTNLSAWLSGAWFDLELVGGAFRQIAYYLPFAHATDLTRAALAGEFAAAWPHLAWVGGYAVLACVLAVFCFLRQMKRQ